MSRTAVVSLVVGTVPALLVLVTLLGLGVLRQVPPGGLLLASGFVVFAPAMLAGLSRPRDKSEAVGPVLCVWTVGLWLALPMFFPGERHDALSAGLSLLTLSGERSDLADSIAAALPEGPVRATPPPPMAAVAQAPTPPEPLELSPTEIALPYEGEGRRLTVPVVFQHGGKEVEVLMMLDTGATYTTLPRAVLRQLGALPGPDAPVLSLSTANGQRQAAVSLLDTVWLGDQAIEGVAITTCEDCQNDESAGLLGLNVSGGFNLTIDADRREVIFARRTQFDRQLDLRPFVDVRARMLRYPGGRVEVSFNVENDAQREVSELGVEVACGDNTWEVSLGAVSEDGVQNERRALPRHEPCQGYGVSIGTSRW